MANVAPHIRPIRTRSAMPAPALISAAALAMALVGAWVLAGWPA